MQSLTRAALYWTLLGTSSIALAEESAVSPRVFSVTTGYFYRQRTDENIAEPRWPSEKMRSNVIDTVFDMSSGYLQDFVKADLAWIGAWNFQKDYRCSEVAFCSQLPDKTLGAVNVWAHNDIDGVALAKAALTFKKSLGSTQWQLRGGYDQFRGGLLGTNWGFLFPGSYRGLQLEGTLDHLTMSAVWTDAYRTPWATEYGHFSTPDGLTIKSIESAGLKYVWSGGYYAELAAGQSTDWQKRMLAKVGWQGKLAEYAAQANYQYYYYKISGKDFVGAEGTYGKQQVVSLESQIPYAWRLSLEYVGTTASSWFNVPEFVPRMSAGYGNSQGRLDYWWNAVSDFNKDGEQAFNLGLHSRTYELAGFGINGGGNLIYASQISGWDTNQARTDSSGFEKGFNLDLNLECPKGPWQPLSVSVHYTRLRAGGIQLDPTDSHSLFKRYGLYSTDDWKFMLIYSTAISG